MYDYNTHYNDHYNGRYDDFVLNENIKVPYDLFDAEKFNMLKSEDKKSYTRAVLKKILELNPNGVTITQITDKIKYFSRPIIWNHLEMMTITREAYNHKFGTTLVYYPNGKMVHSIFKTEFNIENRTYGFFVVENDMDKALYIQEKNKDKLGALAVSGGLIIPLHALDSFIDYIKDVKIEVDKNGRKSRV